MAIGLDGETGISCDAPAFSTKTRIDILGFLHRVINYFFPNACFDHQNGLPGIYFVCLWMKKKLGLRPKAVNLTNDLRERRVRKPEMRGNATTLGEKCKVGPFEGRRGRRDCTSRFVMSGVELFSLGIRFFDKLRVGKHAYVCMKVNATAMSYATNRARTVLF